MWQPILTIFFNARVIVIVRCRAVLHPLKPAVSRSKLRVVVGASVYLCAIASLVPLVLVLKFTDVGFEECMAKPNTKDYLHVVLNDRSMFSSRPILFILHYKICRAYFFHINLKFEFFPYKLHSNLQYTPDG